MHAEHVDLVLGVGGQRDVAHEVREHDEQEQGPDEGEPAFRHLLVEVAPRDVVSHQLVERLDGGLHLVRPRMHAIGHVDHRHAGRDRSQEQVENGLVDGEDPGVDPVVELELVLRLIGVVAPAAAEDHEQHDDPADPHAGEQQQRFFHALFGRLEIARARSRPGGLRGLRRKSPHLRCAHDVLGLPCAGGPGGPASGFREKKDITK